MTRAGRKRKAAQRQPNGQPRREPAATRAENVLAIVLAQPHRRGERSQKAETVLGRLCLSDMITERQYYAGVRVLHVFTAFNKILAGPAIAAPPFVRMVPPGMETPAEAEHLSRVIPETDEERHGRVMAALDRVNRALMPFTPAERLTLDNLVNRDASVASYQLASVRMMLEAIAVEFGIPEDEHPLARAAERV